MQLLPSAAAAPPAGGDEPGSDGGPQGPAAESSLDRSCDGSRVLSYCHLRRQGSRSSRCRRTSLEQAAATGGESRAGRNGGDARPRRERHAPPDLARQVLEVLATQLEQLAVAVAAVEKQLAVWHRSNPVSQRLASIPGIGPIIATALAATVVEPVGLPVAASSRRGWVWCRGSTRPGAKRGPPSANAATATCDVC